MAGYESSHGRVGDYPVSSNQEVQPPIDPAIDPRLFDSSYLTLDPGSEDVGFDDFSQYAPLDTTSMSIGQRRLLQEQVDLSGSNDESDESDDVDDYDDDVDRDRLWNEGKEV